MGNRMQGKAAETSKALGESEKQAGTHHHRLSLKRRARWVFMVHTKHRREAQVEGPKGTREAQQQTAQLPAWIGWHANEPGRIDRVAPLSILPHTPRYNTSSLPCRALTLSPSTSRTVAAQERGILANRL